MRKRERFSKGDFGRTKAAREMHKERWLRKERIDKHKERKERIDTNKERFDKP